MIRFCGLKSQKCKNRGFSYVKNIAFCDKKEVRICKKIEIIIKNPLKINKL